MNISGVSGTESTSTYSSIKKTCSCVHASRSWHFCRALLELPANARVCPYKMNCSLSLVLGGKKQRKQQILCRLEWNENHYLPLHWFQLFFFFVSHLCHLQLETYLKVLNSSTYRSGNMYFIISLSGSSWLCPIRISLRSLGMLHASYIAKLSLWLLFHFV